MSFFFFSRCLESVKKKKLDVDDVERSRRHVMSLDFRGKNSLTRGRCRFSPLPRDSIFVGLAGDTGEAWEDRKRKGHPVLDGKLCCLWE